MISFFLFVFIWLGRGGEGEGMGVAWLQLTFIPSFSPDLNHNPAFDPRQIPATSNIETRVDPGQVKPYTRIAVVQIILIPSH